MREENYVETGKNVASILSGSADIHYGYHYTLSGPDKDFKKMVLGEIPLSTTEKERARLATTSFQELGLTFASYEEVKRVATLFEQRYGTKEYGKENEQEIRQDMASVLQEVRS